MEGNPATFDSFQAFWQRSLMLAVPELPEAKLHDVLLASREALLNALNHGCGGCADQRASLQIAYPPSRQTLRVRVCDPGPGHDFDLARHEKSALKELAEEHRGLVLIHHLASDVSFLRNGASVTMDFAW